MEIIMQMKKDDRVRLTKKPLPISNQVTDPASEAAPVLSASVDSINNITESLNELVQDIESSVGKIVDIPPEASEKDKDEPAPYSLQNKLNRIDYRLVGIHKNLVRISEHLHRAV
jgi:hypothetical protein